MFLSNLEWAAPPSIQVDHRRDLRKRRPSEEEDAGIRNDSGEKNYWILAASLFKSSFPASF